MQARHVVRAEKRWNPAYVLLAGAILLLASVFMPWLEIDTRVGITQSMTVTNGLGFHGGLLLPLALAAAASGYLFLKRRVGLAIRVAMLMLAAAIALVILLGSGEMNLRLSNATHTFGPDLLAQSGLKLGAYLSAVGAVAMALGAVFCLGYQPGLVNSSRQLWLQKHDMV